MERRKQETPEAKEAPREPVEGEAPEEFQRFVDILRGVIHKPKPPWPKRDNGEPRKER